MKQLKLKSILVGMVLFSALIATVVSLNPNVENPAQSPVLEITQAEARTGPLPQAAVKRHYARALASYYGADYAQAARLFTQLKGRVPLALRDDLTFWRAECAFRLGHRLVAKQGFRSYLKKAPSGPRTGLAQSRLSMLDG